MQDANDNNDLHAKKQRKEEDTYYGVLQIVADSMIMIWSERAIYDQNLRWDDFVLDNAEQFIGTNYFIAHYRGNLAVMKHTNHPNAWRDARTELHWEENLMRFMAKRSMIRDLSDMCDETYERWKEHVGES